MKLIKNWRDVLAILLAVIVFPGMWVGQGLGLLVLPDAIVGSTISIETMIAMFYWRRATEAEGRK